MKAEDFLKFFLENTTKELEFIKKQNTEILLEIQKIKEVIQDATEDNDNGNPSGIQQMLMTALTTVIEKKPEMIDTLMNFFTKEKK